MPDIPCQTPAEWLHAPVTHAHTMRHQRGLLWDDRAGGSALGILCLACGTTWTIHRAVILQDDRAEGVVLRAVIQSQENRAQLLRLLNEEARLPPTPTQPLPAASFQADTLCGSVPEWLNAPVHHATEMGHEEFRWHDMIPGQQRGIMCVLCNRRWLLDVSRIRNDTSPQASMFRQYQTSQEGLASVLSTLHDTIRRRTREAAPSLQEVHEKSLALQAREKLRREASPPALTAWRFVLSDKFEDDDD